MWPGFKSRHQHHMRCGFVFGSLPCSKRIFVRFSGFSFSSKTNTSKFPFDLERTGTFKRVKCFVGKQIASYNYRIKQEYCKVVRFRVNDHPSGFHLYTNTDYVSVAHYCMLWIPLKEVKKRIPCRAEKGVYLFFLYLDVLVEQIAKYKEQFVQAVQEVCLHFMSVKLPTRKYYFEAMGQCSLMIITWRLFFVSYVWLNYKWLSSSCQEEWPRAVEKWNNWWAKFQKRCVVIST